MDLFKNYYDFIERVDEHCRQITREYAEHIVCGKGCDGCCLHFSLFPVEAAAISAALRELPRIRVERIRERARAAAPDGACPLLEEGACPLYEARPIICRTHGMPILAARDGQHHVDVCPLNFANVDSLPASAMIDIDRLNTTLVAINGLFTAEWGGDEPLPERIRMAEAILGEMIK